MSLIITLIYIHAFAELGFQPVLASNGWSMFCGGDAGGGGGSLERQQQQQQNRAKS